MKYAVTVRAQSFRWPREQETTYTVEAPTESEAARIAQAKGVAQYWNPNTTAEVWVASVKEAA